MQASGDVHTGALPSSGEASTPGRTTETVTVTYAPSYIGQPTIKGTASLTVQ